MSLLNALLFWLHFGLLIGAVGSGFFLPLPVIFTLIVLHRMHVWIFGGCLLSRFQELLGGIPQNTSFIQLIARRLFGLELTQAQGHRVDYLLATITFATAIVHTLA